MTESVLGLVQVFLVMNNTLLSVLYRSTDQTIVLLYSLDPERYVQVSLPHFECEECANGQAK